MQQYMQDEMLEVGCVLLFWQVLASMVTDGDLAEGRIYPPLSNIRQVSTQLAAGIVEYCYDNGLASAYPEPIDKEAYVRDNQYYPDYDNFVPSTYAWPGMTD